VSVPWPTSPRYASPLEAVKSDLPNPRGLDRSRDRRQQARSPDSPAEDILEQDPPLLPVAWEKIYDGWYNYVKGHSPANYFGIYDVVRWDTVWLDK